MEQITAFKCNYCRKLYRNKKVGEHHETHCYNNPQNRFKCLHCNHLAVEKDEGCKIFHCEKLDIYLHSHVALRRRMEVINRTQKMKLDCNYYSFNGIL